MNQTVREGLSEQDVEDDLKASVGARRELGPDMEDHVVEAFLARIEQRIDERVDRRISRDEGPLHDRHDRRSPRRSRGGVPSTLAISIPLLAIAGGIGHVWGLLIVMIGVVAVTAIQLRTASDHGN